MLWILIIMKTFHNSDEIKQMNTEKTNLMGGGCRSWSSVMVPVFEHQPSTSSNLFCQDVLHLLCIYAGEKHFCAQKVLTMEPLSLYSNL